MTQTQAHNEQELLEKFDRESVTRQPRNRQVALLIAALAFFYSIFHLYTTFYPMPSSGSSRGNRNPFNLLYLSFTKE